MLEEKLLSELKKDIDSLQNKVKERDDLKNNIIKLQEEIISEIGERMELIEKKSYTVFKAGFWTGLVIGTTICIIIDLVIATIR